MARIVIASLSAPTYAGGLAAYARLLAETLGENGAHQVLFLCLEEKHPTLPTIAKLSCPLASVPFPSLWRSFRKLLWPKLAPRPRFHGLLEFLIANVLPDPLRFLGPVDVIHFVGTGWDFFGFALLHGARRKRINFTVCPAMHPGQWGDDHIDLRLYRQSDTVFCLSNHEARHLTARGLDVRKVALCGLPPMCGTDGEGVGFRQKLGLGQRPAVLFIGRRDHGKGYDALLAAWSLVRRDCPAAVLLLVGPPAGSSFELPAEGVVDLHIADEKTKANALAACDIFCLPSAHESFGIVFIEAWSYAKPVICGPAPATRELVANGQTGLWADQTPESVASQLLQLLNDPARARQLGKNGQAHQLANYTPQHMLGSHLSAWQLAGRT